MSRPAAVTALASPFQRSFSSLQLPNYRRWFAGQIVSVSGNWMQTIAELWLIVSLTGSGLSVGTTVALQFLPMLLLAPWGGLLADRFDTRRLLMATQAAMALPALALWALTAGGITEVWIIYALVFVRGAINAIDNPARQSFVVELVGHERVVNAVSLNSVIVHMARIVGPALAGAVIALAGIATCFALNAATFGVMLAVLVRIDRGALVARATARSRPGQLRAGLRYAWSEPALRVPLAMMLLVGTLSFNFQTLLPLLASVTWHGDSGTFALMTATMAVGSIVGALASSMRATITPQLLAGAAALFGGIELLVAVAPTLLLQLIALAALGTVTVTFAAGVNSALQLASEATMRGRVMALYAMVFLGSTAVGAPLVGWLSQLAGPRAGLLLGALAALVAAAYAVWELKRSPRAPGIAAHEGCAAATVTSALRPPARARARGSGPRRRQRERA